VASSIVKRLNKNVDGVVTKAPLTIDSAVVFLNRKISEIYVDLDNLSEDELSLLSATEKENSNRSTLIEKIELALEEVQK
jgi:hypothetical protein